MVQPLFDERQQALHRARAGRMGWRTFLHARAIEDVVDRLGVIQRRFERALVTGCPVELALLVANVAATVEHRASPAALEPDDLGRFDLVLMIGGLEGANDPRGWLHALRAVLAPDSLMLGALVGGDSFPGLSRAMLAADLAQGSGAAPRVHPRIEASAVAALVSDAGFVMPVVDVDRVTLSYRRFDGLVHDLRGMAGGNALSQRSRRPLGRLALAAARAAFEEVGEERVELIHFLGWSPSPAAHR